MNFPYSYAPQPVPPPAFQEVESREHEHARVASRQPEPVFYYGAQNRPSHGPIGNDDSAPYHTDEYVLPSGPNPLCTAPPYPPPSPAGPSWPSHRPTPPGYRPDDQLIPRSVNRASPTSPYVDGHGLQATYAHRLPSALSASPVASADGYPWDTAVSPTTAAYNEDMQGIHNIRDLRIDSSCARDSGLDGAGLFDYHRYPIIPTRYSTLAGWDGSSSSDSSRSDQDLHLSLPEEQDVDVNAGDYGSGAGAKGTIGRDDEVIAGHRLPAHQPSTTLSPMYGPAEFAQLPQSPLYSPLQPLAFVPYVPAQGCASPVLAHPPMAFPANGEGWSPGSHNAQPNWGTPQMHVHRTMREENNEPIMDFLAPDPHRGHHEEVRWVSENVGTKEEDEPTYQQDVPVRSGPIESPPKEEESTTSPSPSSDKPTPAPDQAPNGPPPTSPRPSDLEQSQSAPATGPTRSTRGRARGRPKGSGKGRGGGRGRGDSTRSSPPHTHSHSLPAPTTPESLNGNDAGNGEEGMMNAPPKKKERKPVVIACNFCRARKIACGPPPEGTEDRTCNQCRRRHLTCEYPEEHLRALRKGGRKKKPLVVEDAKPAKTKEAAGDGQPPRTGATPSIVTGSSRG